MNRREEMVKIIDNCCSPAYLDCLKDIASNSENWNMRYGGKEEAEPDHARERWRVSNVEDKFLKLDIIDREIKHPLLAGLAMGLLIQIREASGEGLFVPNIHFCGISIKDKHRPDWLHVDTEEDCFIKILGIINRDWKEEWGGGFIHNEKSTYAKPTSFWIFDPSEKHAAAEIFTDKKRFAIDFTVFKDEQSLERWQKMLRRAGL